MMQASLTLMRYLLAALLVWAMPAAAQNAAQPPQNRMAADLVAEHAPVPGETLTVALRFRPQDGWHGYWSNPGEAGLGMTLDWQLPPGWRAGEPLYPVPDLLWLFDIANHAYERDYAVLVPLEVPAGAAAGSAPVRLDAQWLVCSDQLCVPERATLTLRYPQPSPQLTAQFDADRAAVPPLLDQAVAYQIANQRLRLAIPLPATVDLRDPHVFVETRDVVDYGAVQAFYRDGDVLVAEIPLGPRAGAPDGITGILAFGDNRGVRFTGRAGAVPTGGEPVSGATGEQAPLVLLLGGALLGGLLLNLMPCVFPILSLKALTLARAGESEAKARAEGLAYTAGVVLACLALGAIMLLLRSAGEQVGWAFQLQQPLVVAALLVVAVLVTANLAGLYELPMLPIRSGGGASAFATGLLAAVVATPCTGPFMAAAMGAALLLPATQAMTLFAALGLGLALPFLLLGFVPALRRLLPRPGAWMERFRKAMAVPMGLTALALIWLAWRLGGVHFAFAALALAALLVIVFTAWRRGNVPVAAIAGVVALYFAGSLPFRVADQASAAEASLLDPVPFSDTALAEAQASGRPVFVWFTADWCVTCKVNERVAIERETTRAAFEEAGVTAMRGDWTRADPAITRFLEEQGVAGVPLYLWYPAGGGAPERLPQILTPDMLASRAAR
ncbi:thiol:disulfide interchange protein [Erythrobacter arachoides]|uniref:Thiol:disulfide interchange protein n=1 Tax=Aurantiacibacter arachoides TaxID=1850444 RepID=A0A845A8D1_9SPHN|nr:thioredoxin family protein [Aurantiacibacter arachoides]MXO93799.1 thiol:disulfide interchange protein [Aurantiacibacter arachoides]GGD46583.1 thio:disulfide interchange protein [Aurantiacibacter arachoides]